MNKGTTQLEFVFSKTMTELKDSSSIWDEFSSTSTKLASTLTTLRTVFASYIKSLQKIGSFFYSFEGLKDIGCTVLQITTELNYMSDEMDVLSKSTLTESMKMFSGILNMWKKTIAQCERNYSRDMKIKIQEFKNYNDSLKKVERGKNSLPQQDYAFLVEKRNSSLRDIFTIQEAGVTQVYKEYRYIGCMFSKSFKPILKSISYMLEANERFIGYEEELTQAENDMTFFTQKLKDTFDNCLSLADWMDPGELRLHKVPEPLIRNMNMPLFGKEKNNGPRMNCNRQMFDPSTENFEATLTEGNYQVYCSEYNSMCEENSFENPSQLLTQPANSHANSEGPNFKESEEAGSKCNLEKAESFENVDKSPVRSKSTANLKESEKNNNPEQSVVYEVPTNLITRIIHKKFSNPKANFKISETPPTQDMKKFFKNNLESELLNALNRLK